MKRLLLTILIFVTGILLMADRLSPECVAILGENIYEAYCFTDSVNVISKRESGEDYYNGVHDTFDLYRGRYDIQRNSSKDYIEKLHYYYDTVYDKDENTACTQIEAEGVAVVSGERHEFEMRTKIRLEDILVFTDYTVYEDYATEIPLYDSIRIDGVDYDMTEIDFPLDVDTIEGADEAYAKLMKALAERYGELLEKGSLSGTQEDISFSIEDYSSGLFPTSYYLRGTSDGHEIIESFAIDTEDNSYGYTIIDGHFVI